MVRTKEALFAEMATSMVVAALIPPLETAAPESMMLRALRDALRVAHPACFDSKNNPDLHAEFAAKAASNPQGILASLRLPSSPVQEPTPAPAPSSPTVGAAAPPASPQFSPQEAALLRDILSRGATPAPAPAPAPTPPQFTPEDAAALRELLNKAAPPVVPGDETTGKVG